VVNDLSSLRCVQEALPEQGEAGPPLALALHQLQAMNLAFSHAVALLQGESGSDGDQVIL
jgi:hypothetical protein